MQDAPGARRDDTSPPTPLTGHRPGRYLALGDSYTIGEGIDAAGRWPVQLANALRAQGVDLADPQIIATTGWTTDELSAAINAAGPQGRHDLVSLLIGVNNQYRGRDLANYRLEFTALLQRAIGFAGGRSARVLVLSIPDWGATPYGAGAGRDLRQTADEIDAFNAAARAICAAHGVAFVDITPISRAQGDGERDGDFADDGLHYSAAMHARWVQAALPAARHALVQA